MNAAPPVASQYSPALVADLRRRIEDLVPTLYRLRTDVIAVAVNAPNAAATLHLNHGVGRRLSVMASAIDELFKLVPPENTRATRAKIGKATICLHAFLINAVGVLDNLAWAYIHWHCIDSEFEGYKRTNVDLFKANLQSRLPRLFVALMTTDQMIDWQKNYLKPYRDALAHRIPPYIPESYLPADLELLRTNDGQTQAAASDSDWDEVHRLQDRRSQILGHAYSFIHDLTPPIQPLLLHPQLLADAATVEEIIRAFLASLSVAPGAAD